MASCYASYYYNYGMWGYPYTAYPTSTPQPVKAEPQSPPVRVSAWKRPAEDAHVSEEHPKKRQRDTGKPPYSYIALISMAIADAPDQSATLRQIIDYIKERFPYYRDKGNWESSIRHNLTLNDCFMKQAKVQGEKGHRWAIDPAFKDMFDNGSLLRRRYRYKKGSTKWLRHQAKTATGKAASRLENQAPACSQVGLHSELCEIVWTTC